MSKEDQCIATLAQMAYDVLNVLASNDPEDWLSKHEMKPVIVRARDNLGEALRLIRAAENVHAAMDAVNKLSAAENDVIDERWRQIEVEGWTAEHDDAEHAHGELATAAACYALGDSWKWPWHGGWKPTDRRRDLIKAAALILAEIERLDRAAAKESA